MLPCGRSYDLGGPGRGAEGRERGWRATGLGQASQGGARGQLQAPGREAKEGPAKEWSANASSHPRTVPSAREGGPPEAQQARVVLQDTPTRRQYLPPSSRRGVASPASEALMVVLAAFSLSLYVLNGCRGLLMFRKKFF